MDKPNLKNIYSEKIIQSLKDSFNIKNVMSVPKLDKIVLNMSIGDGKSDKNTLAQSVEELTVVSGQKAVITKAKKAISNFKIRENETNLISELKDIKVFFSIAEFYSEEKFKIKKIIVNKENFYLNNLSLKNFIYNFKKNIVNNFIINHGIFYHDLRPLTLNFFQRGQY